MLSRTVRLLLSAEKMGGRPFSPDTGGETAPPLCGSNPCLLFFFTFIKKKIQQVLHIDFLMDCFHKAAEKLAQDFGLIYDSQAPPRRRYVRQKTEAQKFLDCFHKTGVRFFLRCPGRIVGLPFFQQIVVIGQYAITPLFGKQHHAHLYAEAGRYIGSRIQ